MNATIMGDILRFSKGNPGAMNCLMGMLKGDIENSIAGLTIIPILAEYQIMGTDLYVFWSDLCNKDYQLMAHLCEIVPKETLILACSKQDYSGRVMVEKYAATFNPLESM